MTSSVDFVPSTAGSAPDGLSLASPTSAALFCEVFDTSGVDDFCTGNNGRLLSRVGLVTRSFPALVGTDVVPSGVEVPVMAPSLAWDGRAG